MDLLTNSALRLNFNALSKLKRIQILFTKQFFVAKSLKLDGNNMATLILSLENGSDLVVAQAT